MAKILVSVPGRGIVYKTADEALAMLPGLLASREFQWERRFVGQDYDQFYQMYDTFQGAVEAAIPHYREIGLTFEQAAMLAMDLCLVLSTGIETEEEE